MNPLAPIGMIYGRVMDLRNRLYDRGVLRSHSLGARTISIGNLTAGGTGKTPLVALAARILADSGENVCVLTRGYGRANENDRVLVSDGERVLADAAAGGDEPVELARRLLGKAAVVADANRVKAAAWARENLGTTAFLLDDGFQHRRAKRDLDIVCVDATNPWGNGRILPAGTLRESFEGLGRADVVVVTRANHVASVDGIVEKLRSRAPNAKIFTAGLRVIGFVELSEFHAKLTPADAECPPHPPGPVLAFCGLGNPENFKRQLELEGVHVAGFRSFGDHHRYTQNELDSLAAEAEKLSAASMVTTAKDAVKLGRLRSRRPIYIAETKVELNDEVDFRRQLLRNPA